MSLLELVRLTPEAELPTRLAEIGVGAALDDLLAAVTGQGERRDLGTLALELDHEGVSYARVIVVDADGATAGGVSPSAAPPRATVRVSVVRLLRVLAGVQSATRLVATRRMRLSGDLTWAVATLGSLRR
jgi:hypothetical protein